MEPQPAPRVGRIRRTVRFVWIGSCVVAGALIAAALVGFSMSSLGLGLVAAAPGAALGWLFGRHVSPLDAFVPM